jgi:AcrR family transcriptional regulator
MRIVVAEGFDGLTMPRLAQECDAAIGAVYRYFPGKDALIGALQERAIASFAARLDVALAGVDEPLARVWAAFTAWSAFAADEPEAFALADRSLADPRAVLSDEEAYRVARVLDPLVRRCAGLLEDAAGAGALEPGDALLRAHALWAAVHGAQHFAKRDRLTPKKLHASRIRDALIAGLLVGWGADAKAVKALSAAGSGTRTPSAPRRSAR